MDPSILPVGIVLAATIVLLVSNRVRIDLVAVLATLSLAWLGTITPAEAVSGFASNAVIAMGSVMVLAHGIGRTGITSRLAGAIVSAAGRGERRVIATLSGTVGLLSAFIQNIGAAALFLPATRRIARQTGIPVSRMIMPMGFAAILGGTVTMIASGPLIVVNDLLIQAGEEPFPLFAVTPVGIALLLTGVALFTFWGDRLLPKGDTKEAKPSVAEIWGIGHPVRTCILPPSSLPAGKIRDQASFEEGYGLHLLAVRTGNDITIAPSRYTRLEAGQELAFIGSGGDFTRFLGESGCIPTSADSRLKEILDGEGYGFAELIIRPRASITGKTLREIRFRQRFSIEPIVFVRGETEVRAGFSDIPLAAGDTLVAFGSWDTLRLLSGHRDLLLLTPPEGEGVRDRMGALAIFIFAASLALTLTGVPISLALLTGAAAMVLAGILRAEEAYRAIDWRTIVLIAGLIPLGIAMEKSGMAALVAGLLVGTLAGAHPLMVMAAVAVLAAGLSLIISNVAATVLLVPLVMLTGSAAGIDPRALALLVAVSAQNSFVLPTHQVNALLMGPGGYFPRDYPKPGGILTFLFIIVATTLIYLLF